MEIQATRNTGILKATTFENLYLHLREQEQRVYSDEQLRLLPNINPKHLHHKEWKIRKYAANQLIAYLSKKNKHLNILEIGCGNGWLTAKMAQIYAANVAGIDINSIEIAQAKRVFKKNNLQFYLADFESGYFGDTKFDVIVFAASIQYFKSLQKILVTAQQSLNKNGEIHILATNFYTLDTIANAKERTASYFETLGCTAMKDHYFHHLWESLNAFSYKILYNPRHIFNKILNSSPFYWICVRS
jgi:ubiquinone/menaquinone biosynthesis C-methylase UbiE